MNILLVISSLDGGGAERIISEMANHWYKKGHKITIATRTDSAENDIHLINNGINRIHLGQVRKEYSLYKKINIHILQLVKLRRAISNEDFSAVISFMDQNNIYTLLASIGIKQKIIVSERTDPSINPECNIIWKLSRKILYRYADYVVAQTVHAVQWLIDHCSANAVLIPNHIRQLPNIQEKRKNIILSIGRLVEMKGFHDIIVAFSVVHKLYPNWQLVIVGEGQYRKQLEKLITDLNLGDVVSLQGYQHNIEQWYVEASLLVQASRFEGFPNVLLESMGMGTPVISTNCKSGPSDLIENGVNGILVKTGDIMALSQAMIQLIDNKSMRAKLGTNALKVNQEYNQEKIMALWEKLI